jgi:hypothetical protein
MLLSKKHSKSPPEKPMKKLTKITHFVSKDPLKDTDEESEGEDARTSNIHRPKTIDNTARTVKITFLTQRGDDSAYLKHVELLQKLQEAPHLIQTIYNKRHESLKSSAVSDLANPAIYGNHFDIHQVKHGKSEDKVLNIVVQEYTSHFKLNDIKRQMDLINFLKDNAMKIADHEWRTEDWNTSVIGFLPQYSPSYFAKTYVSQRMTELLKPTLAAPEFRVKPIRIAHEVLGKRLVLQVYAIEVRRDDFFQANKLFTAKATSPEDFVSFRLQRVNPKAYNHAVALAAQIQNNSRMIIIENVIEESFFIFDSQIQSLTEMIGYYHDTNKQTIKIIVHFKEFKSIRKVIQQSIGKWNSMLDPSDVRVTGFPNLVLVSADEYSESEGSQFSGSIDSLLSLDLTSFTIFQNEVPVETTLKEPVSEVTVESYKATIEMQNEKIEKQEAQIEYLISTIQQLNADMNTKFDRMLTLITHKSSEKVEDKNEMIPPGDPTNISEFTSTTKHIQTTNKKQTATPLGNRRQR